MATKLKVNYEFVGDSTTPVTRTESIKHGDSMLNTVINAAAATVNTKADKSYVDTELAKKANVNDMEQALGNKASVSELEAVSDRVSTNTTNIATQTARIDNIANLPEGSTTGDAELIDIRVGADGKTYTSAGNAVRGQISDVKSELAQLSNNIKKVKVEQTIRHKVKNGPVFYNLEKTIPANTEVFWSSEIEGGSVVYSSAIGFTKQNSESVRKLIFEGNVTNTNGSFTFNDTLSYLEFWSANTENVYISISFYWYDYVQAFPSIDEVQIAESDISLLSNKTESLRNSLASSIYFDNKYIEIAASGTQSGYLTDDAIIGSGQGQITYFNAASGNSYKVKYCTGGANPAIWYKNGNVYVSKVDGVKSWKTEEIEITIPSGVDTIAVNNINSLDGCGKSYLREFEILENTEDIDSLKTNASDVDMSLFNLSKRMEKHNVAFEENNFVLTIDDCNQYLPDVRDVCAELSIPLSVSAPYEKLSTTYGSETVKSILDGIVSNGGEILAHSFECITSSSTDDVYRKVFITEKQKLEENGYDVNGIILSGGDGYVVNTKTYKMASLYYGYSDLYGLESSEQFHKGRWWFHDLSMNGAKSIALNYINNKKFIVMAMHGSSNSSDLEYVDNLRELLTYIKTNGGNFTTWKKVHDKYYD